MGELEGSTYAGMAEEGGVPRASGVGRGDPGVGEQEGGWAWRAPASRAHLPGTPPPLLAPWDQPHWPIHPGTPPLRDPSSLGSLPVGLSPPAPPGPITPAVLGNWLREQSPDKPGKCPAPHSKREPHRVSAGLSWGEPFPAPHVVAAGTVRGWARSSWHCSPPSQPPLPLSFSQRPPRTAAEGRGRGRGSAGSGLQALSLSCRLKDI